MKYAVHLSIFSKKWGDEISPLIFLAKKIGFDGFELPILSPFKLDIEPIKEAIEQTGLIPICSTGLDIENDISSKDETIRKNGILFLKKCIDIAFEIGANYLNGLTYSPWGFLQTREEGKDNIVHMIESLRLVADYAEKKKVILNLEVVNRYETYVFNTVQEVLEVIKEIDHPNIGIHYDTFHANIEEKSQYEAIILGGKLIKHVHFASNYRGIPGKGSINFSEIAKALQEIDYNHFISLENAVEPNTEVGTGFNIWRSIEKDGYSAAVEGLRSMKEIMNKEK